MAAIHFTTMPCEPNTACKAQRKPIFVFVLKTLSNPRIEDSITFLYVFMNVAKVFVH